jgi:hypothetical protein
MIFDIGFAVGGVERTGEVCDGALGGTPSSFAAIAGTFAGVDGAFGAVFLGCIAMLVCNAALEGTMEGAPFDGALGGTPRSEVEGPVAGALEGAVLACGTPLEGTMEGAVLACGAPLDGALDGDATSPPVM